MEKQFYPSYIPRKWIHYTHHKKKRIRKKYQNRIRRKVQRHKVDIQTLSFPLSAEPFALTLPQIVVPSFPRLALPQIATSELKIPEIEIPATTLDALKEFREAFEQAKKSLLETLSPIIDCLVKAAKKFIKWASDFWDHVWCKNKRWWYMAEHHKKFRICKKYRNKIKREARRQYGELLELLATDDSEDGETASDDKEGPYNEMAISMR